MQKELTEIHQKVDKIWTAIAGEPQLGTQGIVQKMDQHDKRIKDLEKYQAKDKKMRWIEKGVFGSAGIGIGGTLWPAIKTGIGKLLLFLIGSGLSMLIIVLVWIAL